MNSLALDRSPYYSRYYARLKDWRANLKFRRKLNALGYTDEDNAAELRMMCGRDLLFWLNAFSFIFEPRKSTYLPFLTYPFQDDAFTTLDHSIEIGIDVGIEKSRDMGGSWGVIAVYVWRWLFKANQSFLLVSRNQDLVDKAGNPDSLFWKVDKLLLGLPAWMKPRNPDRTLLHLGNPENESVLDGTSTTGDVGRGGRRLGILLDEFAAFKFEDGYAVFRATQAATDCRCFLSTPKGGAGPCYDVMHPESGTEIVIITLHWSKHPEKNPGLYRATPEKIEFLDPGYRYPDDYQFIRDDKLRSPWYDREDRRPGSTPQLMAQEQDIEYHGAAFPFFDLTRLDQIIKRCRPPIAIGSLHYDRIAIEPIEFEEEPGGKLSLWVNLGADGKPPVDRRYIIGVDISYGTGASNSAAVVYDRATREKAAEFITPHLTPEKFADGVIALAKWFVGANEQEGGAKMIWEAQGPGRAFEGAVKDAGYRHIYYRDAAANEARMFRRRSRIPGFWTTADTMRMLLSAYRKALDAETIINLSETAVNECKEFVHDKNGQIAHFASLNTDDPTAARAAHGDVVIADALANKVLALSPMLPQTAEASEDREPPEVPECSFAGRRKRREDANCELIWID
jgi:hypothetical protein